MDYEEYFSAEKDLGGRGSILIERNREKKKGGLGGRG